VDLTPRTDAPDVEAMRRRMHPARRFGALAAIVVLVAVAAYLVIGTLGDATQFFRNVDEAVADRDDLGSRRFRLQGRVVPGTVSSEGDGAVTFQVMFNCAAATVVHRGDPPELFDNPWIPVLVVGAWSPQPVQTVAGPDSHVFESDELIVKHTNEYQADYGDRVAPSVPAGFFDECPDLRRQLAAGTP
jgi:cytochrome c-type biogenesis protein CcmE